jgi:hypothetical protein
MEIQEFIKESQICSFGSWYAIINSKKVALRKGTFGEKNTLGITPIKVEDSKSEHHWDNPPIDRMKSKNLILLTEEERQSLVKIKVVFLKHTPLLYCVDVDVVGISSMSDFIQQTGIRMFENHAWTPGNNKGIHIYVKITDVPAYANQVDVYKTFKGDFMRLTNVWERIDKKVYGQMQQIPYSTIQQILNEDAMNIEGRLPPKVAPPPKVTPVHPPPPSIPPTPESADDCEAVQVVRLGIEKGIFAKIQGYKPWLNLGFILKNTCGAEGEDLFIQLSRSNPTYTSDDDVRHFFSGLNRTIPQEGKKPLTLATLYKMLADIDPDATKEIRKIVKKNIASIPIKDVDIPMGPSLCPQAFSALPDYHSKKAYFEQFICKIVHPAPLFISSRAECQDSLMCKDSLIIAYEQYLDEDKSFVKKWAGDPTMKQYDNMDYIPYNGTPEHNPKTYNLFKGYPEIIHHEFAREKKDIILAPWMALGLSLCGGIQEHFDYMVKFLAHMIQFPNEKVPIAFIVKGPQGTGKNVFLNVMSSILGKSNVTSSANPQDFFGTHAEGFANKILINMNECEGKSTFDFEGLIKSFITEEELYINPKFVRPTKIRNIARLIIFTNKDNPIPIDVKSGDRRYVVYQTTTEYLQVKYGRAFWTALVAHFAKPQFIACLYDYLSTLDISKTDWRTERPITDAYKQMCKLYTPIEALFFEDILATFKVLATEDPEIWNSEQSILNKDLYTRYTEYSKRMGFTKDFQPNIQKFNGRIKSLEIPFKEVKTNGYAHIKYTPKDVYTFLVGKKYIEREIDDVDVIGKPDVVGETFEFEI